MRGVAGGAPFTSHLNYYSFLDSPPPSGGGVHGSLRHFCYSSFLVAFSPFIFTFSYFISGLHVPWLQIVACLQTVILPTFSQFFPLLG